MGGWEAWRIGGLDARKLGSLEALRLGDLEVWRLESILESKMDPKSTKNQSIILAKLPTTLKYWGLHARMLP